MLGEAAATGSHSAMSAHGYLHIPNAVPSAVVDSLCELIESQRGSAEAGGYLIWPTPEALPELCRSWASCEAARLLQTSLPPGTSPVRLLGGAALWKEPGVHAATPFHQDSAYHDSAGARHAAVWLALTPAGPQSGCLRFAPALGFDLLDHVTLPRASAPSGFETHLTESCAERATRVALDCEVDAGSVVVIGDRVVHGSRAVLAGQPHRLAFSPLFEVPPQE